VKPVRVLVVDDSAFARKVVREILSACPDIEVCDIARDGLEALEKIGEHRPDVITLDLVMPNLDGIGLLKALPSGGPRVVVVSISGVHSALGLEALELGAFDVVQKPTALATDRLYTMDRDLVAKVLSAARSQSRGRRATGETSTLAIAPAAPSLSAFRAVVVGASTGGPPAVSRLLGALPAGFPVPIAVVVHLPVEYTETFARRLDASTPFKVREAAEGLAFGPGDVVIARGGSHLQLTAHATGVEAHLSIAPYETPHRPSVDVLFESVARTLGGNVVAVVLTGMGDDGTAGARALKRLGATILTEAESSCVVYGMPRSVVEAGLSDSAVPLQDMAAEIMRRIR
jgi:two-component system, chemotaxis family, protein-glutamate methylesterase/glutaminase